LTGQVSGPSGMDFDQRTFNYSLLDASEKDDVLEFAKRDILRGFTLPNIQTYTARCAGSGVQEPFLVWTHAPPYPLHNSFPRVFAINRAHTRTIPLFTSLSTTPRTSSLFRTFARFVEVNLHNGDEEGLDKDDMKELGNDLWGIIDGFGDTDGNDGRVDWDELGEDEE